MKTSSSKFLLAALLVLGTTSAFATETPATQAAQPVATVAPSYPYLMRRAEASAEVTVAYTVDSAGQVTSAKVVNSNNHEFDASTLDAIKQWKFAPALKDGKPVEAKILQTFTFSVRDQPEVSTSTMVASNKKSAK